MFWRILSEILFVLPFFYLFYLFRKNKKKFFDCFSSLFLLTFFVIFFKYYFKIPRPFEIRFLDTYSFPSHHAAHGGFFFAICPNIFTFFYLFFISFLRLKIGIHTLTDVLGGISLGLFTPLFLKLIEKHLSFETHRQSLHLGVSFILGSLFFEKRIYGILVCAFLLILGAFLFFLRKKKIIAEFLNFYDRDGKKGWGAFTLVGGIFFVSLFWEEVWKACFITGMIDGFSSLFKKNDKKITFGSFGAGLFGGIVSSHLTGLPLIVGIVGVLIEELSPIDDNLVLPLGVYLIQKCF